MQKLIIYGFLCLFLFGCVPGRDISYKEKLLDGKLIKYSKADRDASGKYKNIEFGFSEYRNENDEDVNYRHWRLSHKEAFDTVRYIDDNGVKLSKKNRIKSDICVYGLIFGFLPPLNSWDITTTDEETINLAIKRLQKKDPNLKGLKYINIDVGTFALPIFGWICSEVSGFPIYADAK